MAEVERDPPLAEVRARGTAPTSRRSAGRRCGRTAALKRMPSGRCTDSTLMTSAPIAASHAVANGPDQNAVKSSTRTPASGRSPDGRVGDARRAVGRGHGACRPRGGGAARDRRHRGSGTARAAGSTTRPVAARTRRAPSSCSNARELGAVADDRGRHPRRRRTRATTSSAVCARVQRCAAMPFTSSARRPRPIIVVSSSSSTRSSRPITERSDRHCCCGDGRDPDVPTVGRRLVARDHHPAERARDARRGSGP